MKEDPDGKWVRYEEHEAETKSLWLMLNDHARANKELADKVMDLVQENEAKQAKIDALMLEFCPDEMPPEQVEEWRKHQRRGGCMTSKFASYSALSSATKQASQEIRDARTALATSKTASKQMKLAQQIMEEDKEILRALGHADCEIDIYSSRVCELGTKSCIKDHSKDTNTLEAVKRVFVEWELRMDADVREAFRKVLEG